MEEQVDNINRIEFLKDVAIKSCYINNDLFSNGSRNRATILANKLFSNLVASEYLIKPKDIGAYLGKDRTTILAYLKPSIKGNEADEGYLECLMNANLLISGLEIPSPQERADNIHEKLNVNKYFHYVYEDSATKAKFKTSRAAASFQWMALSNTNANTRSSKRIKRINIEQPKMINGTSVMHIPSKKVYPSITLASKCNVNGESATTIQLDINSNFTNPRRRVVWKKV